MCPICWINGLIALLIGVGILSIDSPYTPYLIGAAVILTAYSLWRFWSGYQRWENFTPRQRKQNWKTIKRFTQGIVIGALLTSGIFYALHWKAIDSYHHQTSTEHKHSN